MPPLSLPCPRPPSLHLSLCISDTCLFFLCMLVIREMYYLFLVYCLPVYASVSTPVILQFYSVHNVLAKKSCPSSSGFHQYDLTFSVTSNGIYSHLPIIFKVFQHPPIRLSLSQHPPIRFNLSHLPSIGFKVSYYTPVRFDLYLYAPAYSTFPAHSSKISQCINFPPIHQSHAV